MKPLYTSGSLTGFGAEVLFSEENCTSESLFTQETVKHTRSLLEDYQFLYVQNDSIPAEGFTYFCQEEKRVRKPFNVRFMQSPNSLWHKDGRGYMGTVKNIIMVLHHPHGWAYDPSMARTGLGKEETIIPCLEEAIKHALSTTTQWNVTMSSDFLEEGTMNSYIALLDEINSQSKSKEYFSKKKLGIALSCGLYLLYRYENLTPDRQRTLLSTLHILACDDSPEVQELFKDVDRRLGETVHRQKWKPGDTIIFKNEDVFHARIAREGKTGSNPLFRYELDMNSNE